MPRTTIDFIVCSQELEEICVDLLPKNVSVEPQNSYLRCGMMLEASVLQFSDRLIPPYWYTNSARRFPMFVRLSTESLTQPPQ